MDPHKSPGPDGFQPLFFQKKWDVVGDSIFSLINSCFQQGRITENINNSYISLIPKNPNPSSLKDFRPIGLCNTVYKVLTKVISNRIRGLLPSLISPVQSSFIPGRTIEENILVVKEVAHVFKQAKKGKNILAFKIDLTKAYDCLEWDFIKSTLILLNFPVHLISLIMSCITTPTISILFNGEITESFRPSRGIRQGDPLSSYIFVLCMERLSRLIESKVADGTWLPLKIAPSIHLSHLFYADDVFLFGKASLDNIDAIMNTMKVFGEMSGLHLSTQKSKIIFPKAMHHRFRRLLASFAHMPGSSSFGKYLGVKISPNKLKKADYDDMIQKVKDRLRGWQAKLLNVAGRCTLIKSVLNTLPLYNMQTSILPCSILDELEMHNRKFLWNKLDKSHYLPRMSWTKVKEPINLGGLGMKNLRIWNLCFMAKLGWKILKEPDKLWVKILRAKYLKNMDFFLCEGRPHHSPLWRDILKGRDILKKGLIHRIRSGDQTSFWFHDWLGTGPLSNLVQGEIPLTLTHLKVSEVIQNGEFQLSYVSHLLPPDIINEIVSYPLAHSCTLNDDIAWNLTSNGIFSIKSAYHLAAPPLHVFSNSPFNWKLIWHLPLPYKYRMLLWHCAHQILPVAHVLGERIENFNPICIRCNDLSETHLHMLRDCERSLAFWNCIFDVIPKNSRFYSNFFSMEIEEWLMWNLKQDMEWRVCFATALWHLWRIRNLAVFQRSIRHPLTEINYFMNDYHMTVSAFQDKGKQVLTEESAKQWSPPPKGYVKLNTDGGWKSITEAAAGGVVRSDTGHWLIGFSLKLNARKPIVAELMAIREGLKVAKDLKVEKLKLEIDAKSLVLMLENVDQHMFHELGAVLFEVGGLIKSFNDLEIVHVHRDANKVAHHLCAFGMTMQQSRKIHLAIPDWVADFFHEDLRSNS